MAEMACAPSSSCRRCLAHGRQSRSVQCQLLTWGVRGHAFCFRMRYMALCSILHKIRTQTNRQGGVKWCMQCDCALTFRPAWPLSSTIHLESFSSNFAMS